MRWTGLRLHPVLPGRRGSVPRRYALGFAVEELFTNMVKYNPPAAAGTSSWSSNATATLVARVSDPDSERFDVTATPDVGISPPTNSASPADWGCTWSGG